MKSLDPRVTRILQVEPTDIAQPKVPLDQFGTFEVFVEPKEGKPFQHEGIVHAPNLEMAYVLAKEAGIEDPIVLASALLHDTVEDTDTTIEELQKEFGGAIASVVIASVENTVSRTLVSARYLRSTAYGTSGASANAAMRPISGASRTSCATDIAVTGSTGQSASRTSK